MARKENYFVPVKDLLTPEEKEHIKSIWIQEQFGNAYRDYFDIIREDEVNGILAYNFIKDVGDIVFASREIANEKSLIPDNEKSMKNDNFTFYGGANSEEIVERIGRSFLEDLKLRYKANNFSFVYGRDCSVAMDIHKDPPLVRKCSVNIPLYPNYSEYRSTFFYKEHDIENPEAEANYNELRSPVLLNLEKFHSCGGPKWSGDSLGIQFWYKDSFREVIKMLSQNNLLTPTI